MSGRTFNPLIRHSQRQVLHTVQVRLLSGNGHFHHDPKKALNLVGVQTELGSNLADPTENLFLAEPIAKWNRGRQLYLGDLLDQFHPALELTEDLAIHLLDGLTKRLQIKAVRHAQSIRPDRSPSETGRA